MQLKAIHTVRQQRWYKRLSSRRYMNNHTQACHSAWVTKLSCVYTHVNMYMYIHAPYTQTSYRHCICKNNLVLRRYGVHRWVLNAACNNHLYNYFSYWQLRSRSRWEEYMYTSKKTSFCVIIIKCLAWCVPPAFRYHVREASYITTSLAPHRKGQHS